MLDDDVAHSAHYCPFLKLVSTSYLFFDALKFSATTELFRDSLWLLLIIME